MLSHKLLWKLYPTYLLVIITCIVSVAFYAFNAVEDFYLSHVEADLEARAHLAAQHILPHLPGKDVATLDPVVKALGRSAATRITLIDLDGRVLAESDEDPLTMANHGDRPAFLQALAQGLGRSIRHSETLEADLMYVAIPIMVDGRPQAVIRTAVPLTRVQQSLASIRNGLVLVALITAALAAGVSFWVSRRISQPLQEMRLGAQRFAAGDLRHKLLAPPIEEFAALAAALNHMAAQLAEKIETVTRQSQQLKTILSSMIEGVLAVDGGERIISMNLAAVRQLRVEPRDVENRQLHEIVRNSDLQALVAQALAADVPVEADITLHEGTRPRILHATGTMLKDPNDRRIGALVVLHDVTRLRHLETIRRDFVANVSHELKTPITSIKGFVETLREGAVADPDSAARFLDIIHQQADRLSAIIDDLLSLSRIEGEGGDAVIDMAETRVRDVLTAAAANLEAKAAEHGVTVKSSAPTRCPPGSTRS